MPKRKTNVQNNKKFFQKIMYHGVIVLSIILAFISIAIIAIYPKLPSMEDLRNYHPKLPLQVYSEDNVLLGQFGEERRIFIGIDQTPKTLINAILAAEDSRFYEHKGIDVRGILRAIIDDIYFHKLQSGGSTITMQVARNFFLTSKKTFSRKFYEILLAYKIEQSLNKNQILELYINQIFLGQRSYGFAEAAITYFGKTLNQLSLAQYAVLAGLPKAPSAYNPVINPKRALERKNYVLLRMLDAGFINQSQYESAINEKIITIKGTVKDATDSGSYVAELIRQMMYAKYGDSIYSQGYKVITTINSKMQQAAYIALRNGIINFTLNKGFKSPEGYININENLTEKQLNDVLNDTFDNLNDFGDLRIAIITEISLKSITLYLRDGNKIILDKKDISAIRNYSSLIQKRILKKGSIVRIQQYNNSWRLIQLPDVEGALVALNPNTGAIKSLIGGFDFSRNNFNHVTQAMRQPGSGFKPFVYSAALDYGFNANSKIEDSPICYPNGGENNGIWCPKNDDSDKEFLGSITLREALSKSLNIPTVKLIDNITPQNVINHTLLFGFNKDQFQPYLTLSLGANEVTPLQLARAYGVFANGGYLVDPYIIDYITDSTDKVIAKTIIPNIYKHPPVLDPRNAYIMTSMLQDAVRYGTGARVYQQLKRDDIAGKTGTTSANKDVWFNGYTPNLVVITWVGYDTPKTLGNYAYGASVALPIWIDFMQTVTTLIPFSQMQMPRGIDVIPHSTWKDNDEFIYSKNLNESPNSNVTKLDQTSSNIINIESQQTNTNNTNEDSSIDTLIKNLK